MVQLLCLAIGVLYLFQRAKIQRVWAEDFPDVPPALFEKWRRLEIRSIDIFLWTTGGTFVVGLFAAAVTWGRPSAAGVMVQLVLGAIFLIGLIISAVFGTSANSLKQELGIRLAGIRTAGRPPAGAGQEAPWLQPLSGPLSPPPLPPQLQQGSLSRRVISNLIWSGLLALLIVVMILLTAGSEGRPGTHFAESIGWRLLSLLPLLVGLTILIASGHIDLSIGAMVGFSSILIAYMSREGSILPGILLCVPVAVAVGLVNGVLVRLLKAPSVLVTLGVSSLLQGLAYSLSRGMQIFLDDRAMPELPGVIVWVLVLALVGSGAVLVHLTPLPRRAGAGNKSAFLEIGSFVLASLLAVVAGLVMVVQLHLGTPNIGIDIHLTPLMAVIVGGTIWASGRANLAGVVLGLLLVIMTDMAMSMHDWEFYTGRLVQGIIIVIFLPLNYLYNWLMNSIYRQRAL